MTRLMLIVAISTVIGLVSATRLGLFSLLAVSGAYLTILIAIGSNDKIGVAGLVLAIVVVQSAYVLGGWARHPRVRSCSADSCGGGRQEDED